MEQKLIRIENLEKLYQDNGVPVRALHDISLNIGQGEFSAIAGPSGSGKTTLLNLVGALDKPTKGSIFFEGEDLGSKSKKELSSLRLHRLGFVFQAYNLIPVLSALENVEFAMMLLGIPDAERYKRAIATMEELGIAELADKRPNKMSGGQQQRVAVARAIVTNPSVVLADEPTANLDSVTAHGLIELMERMNKEKNITFIFSSHDQQVLDHARRILVLKDGTLVDEINK